jgi:hypothetical protein
MVTSQPERGNQNSVSEINLRKVFRDFLRQEYDVNMVTFSRVMELGAFEAEHISNSFCMYTDD